MESCADQLSREIGGNNHVLFCVENMTRTIFFSQPNLIESELTPPSKVPTVSSKSNDVWPPWLKRASDCMFGSCSAHPLWKAFREDSWICSAQVAAVEQKDTSDQRGTAHRHHTPKKQGAKNIKG